MLSAHPITRRDPIDVSELEPWTAVIEERCGTYFSESRFHFLESCLRMRMAIHGFDRCSDYFRFTIAQNAARGQEWRDLLEDLLNGETSFFRYGAAYEHLSSDLIPSVLRAKRSSQSFQSIRLWSAGCSTGEEAYSMAITAMDTLRSQSCRIHVTGTDISSRVLIKARAGSYNSRAVRDIDPSKRAEYFRQTRTTGGDCYQVSDAVRAAVDFKQVNLLGWNASELEEQDIVFCQNVLIYFRHNIRTEIAGRLAGQLAPGGFLVFAPGELVGLTVPNLVSVRAGGLLVHQRVE